jgi:hypothetical protein
MFTAESAGIARTSLGASESLLPPVGGTGCPQRKKNAVNTRKKILAENRCVMCFWICLLQRLANLRCFLFTDGMCLLKPSLHRLFFQPQVDLVVLRKGTPAAIFFSASCIEIMLSDPVPCLMDLLFDLYFIL